MVASPGALGFDSWALLDLAQIRTEQSFGSGLLVEPGIVLTAFHCVADPDNGWALRKSVAVNLWRDLFGVDGGKPKRWSYRAKVLWTPPVVAGVAPPDIALVQIQPNAGEPPPAPRRPGALIYAELSLSDSEVVALGFPSLLTGSTLPGGMGEGAFAGFANAFQRSLPTISFTSRLISSKDGWEPWRGLSGGPLFRGDAIVGVMRGGQPKFKVDRNLEAEPLATLLRDPACNGLSLHLHAQGEIPGPLSPAELVALKTRLADANVPVQAVRHAYLDSHICATAPVSHGEDGADRNLISRLVDDVAAHGLSAMRKFLARLVADNPAAGPGIAAWAAGKPGVEGFQPVASPPVRPNAEPVVLVKVMVIAETGLRSRRDRAYEVEGWVFDGMDSVRRIDPGAGIREVKHGFGSLPDVIQAFVTTSLKMLPNSAIPMVELALPFDLLLDDVERWMVKITQKVVRPLGAAFALALRSYDRLYDREFENTWLQWRQSWARLPSQLSESSLHWIEADDAWNEALYDAVSGKPLVCVALTCAEAEGIDMLVAAGAPVAVWFRNAPNTEPHAREQILELICGRGIRALPESFKTKRQAHRQEAVWNGIALLIDDPGHLPPDAEARFQSV